MNGLSNLHSDTIDVGDVIFSIKKRELWNNKNNNHRVFSVRLLNKDLLLISLLLVYKYIGIIII